MKLPSRPTVIEDDHTPAEWDQLMVCLDDLTAEQVKELARLVGLWFTGGGDGSKEEYIDIIPEARWDEVAAAYEKVATKKELP